MYATWTAINNATDGRQRRGGAGEYYLAVRAAAVAVVGGLAVQRNNRPPL